LLLPNAGAFPQYSNHCGTEYGTDYGIGKDGDETEEEAEEPAPEVDQQQRRAAQQQMEDFTRNIQRKKEREMADLNFLGGDGSSGPKTVTAGAKVGRNDPCPCGSGKKYKKCHGA
jgi:preprotein translocase subunit SecA